MLTDCYVCESGENVGNFGLSSTMRVFAENRENCLFKDINISGTISDNFRYVIGAR
jgi:hypothetical protein